MIELKYFSFSTGLRILLKLRIFVTELRKASPTWFNGYAHRILLLTSRDQTVHRKRLSFNQVFVFRGGNGKIYIFLDFFFKGEKNALVSLSHSVSFTEVKVSMCVL